MMNQETSNRLILAAAAALLLWAVYSLLGAVALYVAVCAAYLPLRRTPSGRVLQSLLLVLPVLWILHQARWVVYPLLGAVILAYLLAPLVDWIHRRGIRRPLAAVGGLLPFGFLLALVLLLLVPALVRQATAVVEAVPAAYESIRGTLEPVLSRIGFEDLIQAMDEGLETEPGDASRLRAEGGPAEGTVIPPGAAPATDPEAPQAGPGVPRALPGSLGQSGLVPGPPAGSGTGNGDVPDHPLADKPESAAAGSGPDQADAPPFWVDQLSRHAATVLRTAFSGISGVGRGLGKAAQILGLLILTPVLAYYLLVDWNRLREGVLNWLPERWHPLASRFSSEAQSALGVYVRGQVLVAAIETLLFYAAFRLAGLEQALTLAALAGILSLVPILGFWLTAILVVLSALTGPAPWVTLLKASIGLAAVNILEGQVLVPRVQGRGLNLHPLVVLLGVLFFGTLFGLVGMLLAVPCLAVIRAFLPLARELWRQSDLYRGLEDEEQEGESS